MDDTDQSAGPGVASHYPRLNPDSPKQSCLAHFSLDHARASRIVHASPTFNFRTDKRNLEATLPAPPRILCGFTEQSHRNNIHHGTSYVLSFFKRIAGEIS